MLSSHAALLTTLGISVFPVFVILFIPLIRKDAQGRSFVNTSLLHVLLAFAVGGLLGDAFLHLIPHSLTPRTSEKIVGLLVLAGLLVFFLLERFIRLANPESDHGHCSDGGHTHSHAHSHSHGHSHSHSHSHSPAVSKESPKGKAKDDKASPEKNEDKGKKEEKKESTLPVVGILNLIADFSHNVTDGMAIAASFLSGNTLGYSTGIAILMHEIPHEIGDYALLVQSGMSQKKAILMQLVTAIGAFAGCGMGLLAGGTVDWFQDAALPFTAGGFIYIALVDTLPSLVQDSSHRPLQLLAEGTAFLAGTLAMAGIALYE